MSDTWTEVTEQDAAISYLLDRIDELLRHEMVDFDVWVEICRLRAMVNHR